MEFIRARSNEQKSLRLKQIVRAALELYETTPFEKITLAAIAGRLDFSRANLYKYVSSKEEIYLLVISNDLESFVQDVLDHFAGMENMETSEFSRRWSEELFRHRRLLELLSVLFSIIERNVTARALADFKREMYGQIGRLQPLFARLLPRLNDRQSFQFLYMQLHYAVGLYPSTSLTEIQREALRISKPPITLQGFVPSFSHFIDTLLRGLYCEPEK